ncbi:hypothetical protein [Fictibacillus norfolkensis]|uniref:Uncharacterized protein n=1 Tax=Fictibacillus norfolkensis TaxID=2762233 RepID=A0ABR8SR49_9BACL|nr:hypothetical protein [Fictibacillus norfolkensis]MBD7965979.1 hypothetical protein [Fictibacillus norfolkensis]
MRKKFDFIFELLLLLISLLGMLYFIYIDEWKSIFFLTFLLVAVGSALRLSKEIKDGYR